MPRLSENRFLADLYTKDPVQAAFLQSICDGLDKIATDTGTAIEGDGQPPAPVNAITVKTSGELVHATLSHGASVNRVINYFLEADTNPSFTQPHVMDLGASRTHIFSLPSLNDAGNTQGWYLRAYAQYPGSPPSNPTVLGGLTNPTPLNLSGNSKLTPLASTGSGTASSTGQQGGSGRGRQRVSTPKVIRVGRSQASNTKVSAPSVNPAQAYNLDQIADGTTYTRVLAGPSAGLNTGTAVTSTGNLMLKNINDNPGSTSGPTTSSTTYAVIPEMTQTLTFHGNPVLLLFTMSFSQAAGNGAFAIFKDGVQLSQDYSIGTANATLLVAISYIDTPTAASHTYDIRWKVAVNTYTFTAVGTARRFQILELG